MSGLTARQIRAPVFGQVQCTVDEGMAQRRDVGEEDSDLAVFHTPGEPAILGSHASGVTPAFGEAAFVNGEDREERLV